MCYWSESRYLKIKRSDELVEFRISKHRAVGKFFCYGSHDCDRFLSVFIGDESPHEPSPIAYTEVQYSNQVFQTSPQKVVESIFYALKKFVNNENFEIDPKIGIKTDYPKEREFTKDEVDKIREYYSQVKESAKWIPIQDFNKQIKKENTMKKLNITKKQYSESKYLQKKYGKLEYVSESGKVFKTSKGHLIKLL